MQATNGIILRSSTEAFWKKIVTAVTTFPENLLNLKLWTKLPGVAIWSW